MKQTLQQWRLVYDVEDDAFESLIVVISAHGSSQENLSADSFAPNMLSPSFLSNVNDGVSGQNKATSQLWQSYVEFMLLLTSKVNSFTSYVSSAHSAEASPSSNAIVLKPVENSAWSSIIAQKKNLSIACVKCWAKKKKICVGSFLRQGTIINGSFILVRLENSMREMHRSNNDSFTSSFVLASPFS